MHSINAVDLAQLYIDQREVQMLESYRALCLEGFTSIRDNVTEVRMHGLMGYRALLQTQLLTPTLTYQSIPILGA